MTTLELRGRITEEGDLEIRLPAGLPAGEVTVRIDVPTMNDWEQQPRTDEEINEMIQPKRSSFKEMVEWLESNPPVELWGELGESEDAAEYVHKMSHQTHFTL